MDCHNIEHTTKLTEHACRYIFNVFYRFILTCLLYLNTRNQIILSTYIYINIFYYLSRKANA